MEEGLALEGAPGTEIKVGERRGSGSEKGSAFRWQWYGCLECVVKGSGESLEKVEVRHTLLSMFAGAEFMKLA